MGDAWGACGKLVHVVFNRKKKPEGKKQIDDTGVDVRILLKWA
jgi:hypothetical protein